MSDGKHDRDLEDVYSLIGYAQSIIEKKGMRAHFPAHIYDEKRDMEYTIDYTDEEIN